MGALVRHPGAAAPREAAIADTAFALITPEMHAEWLATMSVLDVDHAADIVRSIIPEAPPAAARMRSGNSARNASRSAEQVVRRFGEIRETSKGSQRIRTAIAVSIPDSGSSAAY